MSIFLFIVILVVLVWVHELGHFSAAKLFGIRVDEFAIGFPPRLFTLQWGETRYSFNLLLIGGYVSIHGENGQEKGEAKDPRAFTSKPRPVQAAVIVAGILFNVVFAWMVLAGGFMAGLQMGADHQGFGQVTNARPTIVGVMPGSPAEAAGIKPGDVVEQIHTATDSFDLRTLSTDRQAGMVHDFLVAHESQSVGLVVDRGGEEKDFIVKAKEGIVDGRKVLGIELDDVGVLRLPPHLAVLQAGLVAKNILWAEASGLGNLVKGLFVGGADLTQVSGPVGIVSIGSQLVSQGFSSTVTIIALISLNLALINIVPIPGLDGGRLLFIAIESVIRRPINQRWATGFTILGFATLLLLMLLVSVNDIVKLVG